MTPPRATDAPGLYELMQALRVELLGRMDKHGERLVALGFKFDQLAQQNQELKDRVREIEIERKHEDEDRERERTTDRRVSAVIGTSAAVIWQIAKEAWIFYRHSAG